MAVFEVGEGKGFGGRLLVVPAVPGFVEMAEEEFDGVPHGAHVEMAGGEFAGGVDCLLFVGGAGFEDGLGLSGVIAGFNFGGLIGFAFEVEAAVKGCGSAGGFDEAFANEKTKAFEGGVVGAFFAFEPTAGGVEAGEGPDVADGGAFGDVDVGEEAGGEDGADAVDLEEPLAEGVGLGKAVEDGFHLIFVVAGGPGGPVEDGVGLGLHGADLVVGADAVFLGDGEEVHHAADFFEGEGLGEFFEVAG